MASIIAHIGDCHIGSTVALCPPAVNLPDGGTYRANEAQLEIWEKWLYYWDEVKRLRGVGRKKRKLFVIVNGEIIDGDHHDTSQLISRNCVTQLGIAIRTFEPVFALKPDHIFIIRGTPAHSGESGQWDEAFARDIGAEPDEEHNTHSWFHLKLPVEDIKLDIAHHGAAGRLHWTYANSAHKLAAMVMIGYCERGEPVPDLVLRGHTHKAIDIDDAFRTIRVIYNPSWQLATAYAHRIAPGEILPIGGNIILVDGEKYEVTKIKIWPKPSEPWQPKT